MSVIKSMTDRNERESPKNVRHQVVSWLQVWPNLLNAMILDTTLVSEPRIALPMMSDG